MRSNPEDVGMEALREEFGDEWLREGLTPEQRRALANTTRARFRALYEALASVGSALLCAFLDRLSRFALLAWPEPNLGRDLEGASVHYAERSLVCAAYVRAHAKVMTDDED